MCSEIFQPIHASKLSLTRNFWIRKNTSENIFLKKVLKIFERVVGKFCLLYLNQIFSFSRYFQNSQALLIEMNIP